MAQHRDTEERKPRRSAGEVRALVVGIVAGVVRWIGLLIALILVIHVILTVGGANPSNGITGFFRSWADTFVLGFQDLFVFKEDAKAQVLVNYGVAAIFWLVVSSIVTRLIRRLA